MLTYFVCSKYTRLLTFNAPVATNTVKTVVALRNDVLDLGWRLQAMYPEKDTVRVYLRSSSPPYSLVDSGKGFPNDTCITCNGYFRDKIGFMNTQSGDDYYVVVKHRNSMETWSANPITFFVDTLDYNFTDTLSRAYGNNMIYSGDIAAIYSGDVNQDGIIDLTDIISIFNDATNLVSGYVNTDVTGDNFVDLTDLLIAYNNSVSSVILRRP